jgi:hypothetical protein
MFEALQISFLGDRLCGSAALFAEKLRFSDGRLESLRLCRPAAEPRNLWGFDGEASLTANRAAKPPERTNHI